VVIITHEMRVVEEICDRVAVLDHGKLMEIGSVQEVFANPKTNAAKRLILLKEDAWASDEEPAAIEE